MNDIEILKANLNAEKVFYNLRWHELIPEGSSDNSNTETNSNISLNSATDLSKQKSCNKLNKTKSNGSQKTPRDISSPKKAIIREPRNDKNNSPDEILNKSNANRRFHKRFSLASAILDMLSICFNINKCCCKERNGFKYIEEVEDEHTKLLTDFKPPVDIFYNEEKVLLFCLVSGKIKHLQVSFDKSNDILTVSGTKLLYDHFNDENFVSHEIKSGYFKRMFLLKKNVFEEEVTYHYENGVIKIVVPFRKEE